MHIDAKMVHGWTFFGAPVSTFSGSTPRWRLSAPESYVLLNGPRASGVEAFKKALLELVALGALIIQTRREPTFLLFTREIRILLPGPKAPSVGLTVPPLVDAWELFAGTSVSWGRGVRTSDLGRSARARNLPLKDYARRVVMPALVERGLYRRAGDEDQGWFRTRPYVETAAGTAARAELEAWMREIPHEFRASSEQDPSRALALVGMVGSAVLLMDPLFPELQRLSRLLRDMGEEKKIGAAFGLAMADIDLDSLASDWGAVDSAGGDFGSDGGGDGGDSGGGGD